LRDEVLVQDGVVATHASVRSALLVMISPDREDIVELSSAEANKMIQSLPADTGNIALDKRIRFRGLYGNAYTSHVRFPERVEFIRVLSVPVSDKESWLDALVLHPH